MIHCDWYIDHVNDAPECLRRFIRFNRWPASYKIRAGRLGIKRPKLFATVIATKERVQVVMASRFGDLGITIDLALDNGYTDRVCVGELENFSETP